MTTQIKLTDAEFATAQPKAVFSEDVTEFSKLLIDASLSPTAAGVMDSGALIPNLVPDSPIAPDVIGTGLVYDGAQPGWETTRNTAHRIRLWNLGDPLGIGGTGRRLGVIFWMRTLQGPTDWGFSLLNIYRSDNTHVNDGKLLGWKHNANGNDVDPQGWDGIHVNGVQNTTPSTKFGIRGSKRRMAGTLVQYAFFFDPGTSGVSNLCRVYVDGVQVEENGWYPIWSATGQWLTPNGADILNDRTSSRNNQNPALKLHKLHILTDLNRGAFGDLVATDHSRVTESGVFA